MFSVNLIAYTLGDGGTLDIVINYGIEADSICISELEVHQFVHLL